MQWIKSLKKRPELSETVLGYMQSPDEKQVVAIFISEFDSGWWYVEEKDTTVTSQVMTHWMPLSENRKEGRLMKDWIKSSDRLPENENTVLVFTPRLNRSDFAFYSAEFDDWWVGDFAKYASSSEQVTHWMPLPENPKE